MRRNTSEDIHATQIFRFDRSDSFSLTSLTRSKFFSPYCNRHLLQAWTVFGLVTMVGWPDMDSAADLTVVIMVMVSVVLIITDGAASVTKVSFSTFSVFPPLCAAVTHDWFGCCENLVISSYLPCRLITGWFPQQPGVSESIYEVLRWIIIWSILDSKSLKSCTRVKSKKGCLFARPQKGMWRFKRVPCDTKGASVVKGGERVASAVKRRFEELPIMTFFSYVFLRSAFRSDTIITIGYNNSGATSLSWWRNLLLIFLGLR